MELELKIRGDSAELERVIRFINQTETSVKRESGIDLDTAVFDFVQGLREDAPAVIRLFVDASTDGSGLPEYEIEKLLGRKPYGVVGGLARRWSSIAGSEFGTPFRKQGSGSDGVYRLSQELAASLSKALGH